jgi:hypothetical protein
LDDRQEEHPGLFREDEKAWAGEVRSPWRGVADARSGNGHAAAARRWLQGEDARILWDGLGIHPDHMREWLKEPEPVMQDRLPGF